ncbi:MAG: DNA helicase RecQ [Acidobacteria bacterium]|nr:DNA helicase RecQ [Acidobacteriota bacterium]
MDQLIPFDIGSSTEDVLEVVRRYWGFDELRPLQHDAIRAGMDQRDSLVVLPTGGGKSLCYQVPPLLTGRTDIVVSPLISLMKDQVDGLRTNGYPAAALHSGLDPQNRSEAEDFIASGDCRLVFVSPERLVTPWFLNTVEKLGVSTFAVDEAHCISHWGHDFRPEYRQLAVLKERVPGASIHAYTATATERVRDDICAQLALVDPTVLVGNFDRPNLLYRLVPRLDLRGQVREVLHRHENEAVIIYCISRKETERLAGHLQDEGHQAAYYHAGMDAAPRRQTQERFANEELDVIVATVAFGMGIDRSNVRCVVHIATPKSIEHYQQETGRAGRDGLEAECVLLHSPADTMRWQTLMERSAAEGDGGGLAGSLALLDEIRRYCAPGKCRHQALVEHFGQAYDAPGDAGCGACDVCLGETEGLVEATKDAQMILSCVARLQQSYGMGHVADVLRGAKTERIRSLAHDELSTYGLMEGKAQKQIMNLIFQLLDQELLTRSPGEYPVLLLNDASLEVMRGERTVHLVPAKAQRVRKSSRDSASWEGVDMELFERLRGLRTELARERDVPPYLIFGDASLRDMAASKPSNETEFLAVHGVGEKKLKDLGEVFLAAIASHGD